MLSSYQTSLNDNELFNTKNPTSTTSSQSTNNNNNNNVTHTHQLHQSKLALESVTNSTGTTTNPPTSLSHISGSLFNDNNPSDQVENDFDSADTNLDNLNSSDSPSSIINPSHDEKSSATNNNLQRSSTSFCGHPMGHRRSASFLENSNNFHTCKETYVIVTSNVLYIDLVRTVVLQLGYSAMDLINAKGE